MQGHGREQAAGPAAQFAQEHAGDACRDDGGGDGPDDAGCPGTAWVKSDVGDKEVFKCMCHNSEYDPRQGAEVVFGPAPRRLAALPLALSDGSLTVAGNIGKVGGQQPG